MFRHFTLVFLFCVICVKCDVQITDVLQKTCSCGNRHGSVIVQRITIPFQAVDGLYWSKKFGHLVFVDKTNASIGFYNPEKGHTHVHKIEELEGVKFLAVYPIFKHTGKLALFTHRSVFEIKLSEDLQSVESVKHITNLTNDEKFRISKGTIDPNGKFIAGLVYENESDYKNGQSKIVRLVNKDKIEVVAKGFNRAQSIAFNKYYDKMYVVDRRREEICEFDYDADSGEARNEKVIFKVEDFPEIGNTTINCITADKEDNLYIGVIGSYQILMFNVHQKIIFRRIGIPNSVVTSMSYGGETFDVLYVGTSQRLPNLEYIDLTKEPTAGSIYGIYGLTSNGFQKPEFHSVDKDD